MTMQLERIKNSAWIIGGKLIIFALSFGLITALANLASKETVGIYNYVTALLAIASIATLPGMNSALTGATARGNDGNLSVMTRLRMKWGMVGSVVALGIAGYYAVTGDMTLAIAFFIGAWFVPLTDTASDTIYYFFVGKKRYGRAMGASIIVQLVFVIPTMVILFFTDNIIIILSSFWIFQVIGSLIAYQTVQRENNIVDPEAIKFGFHLTGMAGLRVIAGNIDRVIVFALLGPTTVAAYAIANTPYMKLEQLVPIEALALPELAKKSFTSQMKRKLLGYAAIGTIIMIPVVAFGIFITPIVFGTLFPSFGESVHLFQILLIGFILVPFGILRTGLVAWQRKKALYVLEISSPIVRITLFAILGTLFGLLGIVAAIVIARFIDATVTTVLFLKSSTV